MVLCAVLYLLMFASRKSDSTLPPGFFFFFNIWQFKMLSAFFPELISAVADIQMLWACLIFHYIRHVQLTWHSIIIPL